jgi:hypothetical protein
LAVVRALLTERTVLRDEIQVDNVGGRGVDAVLKARFEVGDTGTLIEAIPEAHAGYRIFAGLDIGRAWTLCRARDARAAFGGVDVGDSAVIAGKPTSA